MTGTHTPSASEVSDPQLPVEDDAPSLAASVRRGVLWIVLSTLLLRLSNIVVTAVVAHILAPRDFGVFTVALTAYTIISALGELGIASCLIRADLDIDDLAPTMVTLSWTMSAIFSVGMAAFAGHIATALGSADGANSIRIMALAVLISGVFAVPGAQLTRDFKQDKLFLANVISLIPSTVVLLLLAKSGSGAMAFAWSRVVAQFVMGWVMAASTSKYYPPGFSRGALSVLFRFGLPLAGANFVNFVLLNVDYAFVGHLIGAVALGAYMLAFTLASSPGFLLGTVINNVSMPAFSRVRHDPDLLKNAMASALRAVSLILMPMCGLLMVLARPLVLTLYGAKWAASAEVLSILSLYGGISIICVLFANMLTSLGKAKFILIVQLLWLGMLVPAMTIGVHRDGIVGAAWAHIAVIGPIVLPTYLVVLRRSTGVGLIVLGRAILPPLLSAAAAALAAKVAAAQFSGPVAQLAAGLAVGALVYVIAAAPQASALLSQEQAARLRSLPLFRLHDLVARMAGAPASATAEPAWAAGPAQVAGEPARTAGPPASAGSGRDDDDTVILQPVRTPAWWGMSAPIALAGSGPDDRLTIPMPAIMYQQAPVTAKQTRDVPRSVRSSVAVLRPAWGFSRPATAAARRERLVNRRAAIAWSLLILNVLTYYGTLVHVPSGFGKLITQGALPAALLVALTANRRVIIRPNVFLCLVSLLVVEAIITSLEPQHFGTVYRTFRLAEFVVALWLLSPWWGRRDLLLVRAHLTSLGVILGSVVLGLFVAPGKALNGHRLGGVLWVIPATQVAHYAAVVAGLVVVLWLSGELRGRFSLTVVSVAGIVLILTHTRTALIGLVAGILVAGISLIAAKARARRFFVGTAVAAAVAMLTLSSVITAWLARGEGTQQLYNLTGRTKVWGPLLAFPRDRFQEIFGFGLSNSSFNGLPIDSNWLASYQEQGLIGVIICAALLLFLLVTAYFQPRGVQRALALFLVTYCLVASFTEVGFTDASMYLLELTLAASLIVSRAPDRRAT
jgi:PST family polysaccharide transporter